MSQRNDNLLLKRQMCAFSCDMSEDYAPSFVFVAFMFVLYLWRTPCIMTSQRS